MSAIGGAVVFVLGVYLSVRSIAALYRVLDLWYTIGTAWPRVALEIGAWTGVVVFVSMLLPQGYRAALGWGIASYVVFYVTVALILSRIVMPRLAARSGRE